MLLRQAARSIWRGKRSYLACVVLMAVGIAVYVSFNLLFANIHAAMEGMYRDQKFGDAFASVRAIPLGQAEALESIPGIARAEATVVADARLLKEGSTRAITLRLSSYAPENPDRLNNFLLVEGSLPGDGEILVSLSFAQANAITPGDAIPLVLNGQSFRPRVSGLVQSPEYVYAIPDGGQLMPDNEAFGFGYMAYDRLSILAGKSGSATNLSFLLEEGATYRQVEYRLEDALRPYGLAALFARKDQPSHSMLSQEVGSLESMATSLPMVFILMAVIILYIMLKRIVEQERSQIGTMKAFGLSDAAIVGHYLCYGGITGVAGGVLGVLLGVLMTGSLTAMYLDFFSLPAMEVPPDPRYLAIGLLIAMGSGVLGAFMGARGILRLTPSQAMRPAAPPGVRGDLVGRLPLLRRLLSSFGYMAVRNIARNKFRSTFIVVGVAFSFAITAFMSSFGDIFDRMLLNQFTKVELYNLKISLKEPTAPTAALESAFALESVRRAEALLELPVELRSGHLKKTISLTAMEEGSTLYQIYDNEEERVFSPPMGGIILTKSLAEDLQVERGSLLTLQTPYTGEEEFAAPVLAVIDSNLGVGAYMAMEGVWRLLGTAPAVTSLILDVEDPGVIKDALLDADRVAAVTDQTEMKQIYVDLLDTYAALIYMMQFAGVIIAVAIITNTATISLNERKREYATMKVMGMHPREIGQVVGFEYWALGLVALLPGIVLTRVIKEGLAGMIDSDLFSMPVYTAPSSFLSAAVLCALAVALSNWSARRKITRFDMVEVLKERE